MPERVHRGVMGWRTQVMVTLPPIRGLSPAAGHLVKDCGWGIFSAPPTAKVLSKAGPRITRRACRNKHSDPGRLDGRNGQRLFAGHFVQADNSNERRESVHKVFSSRVREPVCRSRSRRARRSSACSSDFPGLACCAVRNRFVWRRTFRRSRGNRTSRAATQEHHRVCRPWICKDE